MRAHRGVGAGEQPAFESAVVLVLHGGDTQAQPFQLAAGRVLGQPVQGVGQRDALLAAGHPDPHLGPAGHLRARRRVALGDGPVRGVGHVRGRDDGHQACVLERRDRLILLQPHHRGHLHGGAQGRREPRRQDQDQRHQDRAGRQERAPAEAPAHATGCGRRRRRRVPGRFGPGRRDRTGRHRLAGRHRAGAVHGGGGGQLRGGGGAGQSRTRDGMVRRLGVCGVRLGRDGGRRPGQRDRGRRHVGVVGPVLRGRRAQHRADEGGRDGIERRGVTAGAGVRIRGGLLEGREERGARGEPVLRILAQGAQHHGVERGRQVGVDVGGRRRLLAHVLIGHGQRRVTREGGSAREQLEQQAAGRVEVGAAVHDAARRLLRGQVEGRAHHGLGLRRGGGGVGQRMGDPEVHHLDGARLRDHDVRGLHVAVDDALLMRVLERFQHAPGPGHGTVRAHGALGVQDLPQRPAGDELHHQERAVHRMEAVLERDLARVVHGDDRGVVQGGRRACLLAEACLEVRIARQVPAHQLDRHRAV